MVHELTNAPLMFAFIKMHGLGNDFVIIDGREQALNLEKDAIMKITDRHYGVGCDQLIYLEHPIDKTHDIMMTIYNTDGSQAQSCGNATRCVANILLQELPRSYCTIKTLGGLRYCKQIGQNIVVDMGLPSFKPDDIGLSSPNNSVIIDDIDNRLPPIHAVSIGNPHAVILLQDDDICIDYYGPFIETHPYFTQKTNVEFVKTLSVNDTLPHYQVKIWERGVGVTLACGSGACAVFAVLQKLYPHYHKVKLSMDGGDLYLYHDANHHIMMEGTTAKTFTGFWLGS